MNSYQLMELKRRELKRKQEKKFEDEERKRREISELRLAQLKQKEQQQQGMLYQEEDDRYLYEYSPSAMDETQFHRANASPSPQKVTTEFGFRVKDPNWDRMDGLVFQSKHNQDLDENSRTIHHP